MNQFKFLKKEKITKLPGTAGVYAFRRGKDILYVGKSTNLRERVKNHLNKNTWRDNLFIVKANQVGYIQTGSEIEALILEANLIKKYQPKYNVLWRDDKNYFFVAITKEKLPRVFITHQIQKSKFKINYLGPFVEGTALKKTLRFLRKVFPYYSAKKHPKILCPWCHLNLCPGPAPEPKEYRRSIKNLIKVLKGQKKSVSDGLKKEMAKASQAQDFERAAKIRDQFVGLEKVLSHAKVLQQKTAPRTGPWYGQRVEAYDVSNIRGKFAAGSMVVFTQGLPDKKEYRKFKIRLKNTPDDTAMLKEVLTRRFRHTEWPFPDLILVDGGKAQLNAAKKVIINYQLSIIIIALIKDRRHKGVKIYTAEKKEPTKLASLSPDLRNLIMQIDEEAHRFAVTYHRKLRRVDLLGKF